LDSAFAPSMMKSRGTAGSSPRSTRLSMSAWTVTAFSVPAALSAAQASRPYET
jgi:hypothetical protein